MELSPVTARSLVAIIKTHQIVISAFDDDLMGFVGFDGTGRLTIKNVL